MKKILAMVNAILLLALSSGAFSANVSIEIFAQVPGLSGVKISPDGDAITYFLPYDGRTHLAIEELGGDGQTVLVPPIENMEFMWVHWANDDRLVLATRFSARRGFTDTAETRLLGIDRDGDNVKRIVRNSKRKEVGSHVPVDLPPPAVQHTVVDWLPDDPEHILVTMDADHDKRWEIRQINVMNGRYKIIDRGPHGAQDYITDDSGRPRFGKGYRGGKVTAWFRPAGREWRNVSDAAWWVNGHVPLKFVDTGDIAYVAGRGDNGRAGIKLLNLATGEFVDTIFEHELVDVDTLLMAPVTEKAVGVRYTVDLPSDEYFDDEMALIQRSVDKALPNAWNDIRSSSRDRRQVIVYSSSALDPGSYYHWDREAKSFNFLGEAMPGLPTDTVMPKQAISYESRDGVTIPGYLTLPSSDESGPFPTVVLPHGGPKDRDDIRFSYLVQFLASRGYAVLQPNFRGSTGYGIEYLQAGVKQWGGRMQDDITDGVNWLIEQGVADAGRTCIVGWSYGGYAAAMGAIKTPDLYQCAVSINGVMDLVRLIGQDKTEMIGGEAWVMHMGLEGESAKMVSPLHQAQRIRIPMLIVQAKDDVRVTDEQGRSMYDRLRRFGKDVDYIEIPRGGHSLTNAPARARMLQALEEFLGRHLQ